MDLSTHYLGLDLTTVGSRMSETVLRAGIEEASYKIMGPIYAAKPIQAQGGADPPPSTGGSDRPRYREARPWGHDPIDGQHRHRARAGQGRRPQQLRRRGRASLAG